MVPELVNIDAGRAGRAARRMAGMQGHPPPAIRCLRAVDAKVALIAVAEAATRWVAHTVAGALVQAKRFVPAVAEIAVQAVVQACAAARRGACVRRLAPRLFARWGRARAAAVGPAEQLVSCPSLPSR